MDIIASTDNIHIKNAAALKQKKYRDKTNLFLLEGVRLIETALQNKAEIRECFYIKSIISDSRAAALIEKLSEQGCFIHEVSPAVFNKLSDTDSPQGIIAAAQKNNVMLDDIITEDKKNPTFIILDKLQDPGNIGTIIRTADAAGMDGVITIKGTVDLFSPKAVRSSMGAIFSLPIADKIDVGMLETFVKKYKINLVSTVVSDKAKPCFSVDYKTASAIVFGNEGMGISKDIYDLSDEHIFIPMFGKSESFNAASAAAMVMYEIMRQKYFD